MDDELTPILYFVTVLVGVFMVGIGAVLGEPPSTRTERLVASLLLGWGGGFLVIVGLKLTIWLVFG